MIFTETRLPGAFLIDIKKLEDARGFFARGWCQREFEEHGLVPSVVQANISYNYRRGTLRGMHYQVNPFEETKLVRCTRGAIYDVIIDLRHESSTYMEWLGAELTERNYRMLFVPRGFAHGFITLQDDCEVTYQVSEFYTPNSERGIRFDDPAFNIQWPATVEVISDKDCNWPRYQPQPVTEKQAL